MRVILLCSSAPNQMALANKIHASVPLSGIYLRVVPCPKRRTLVQFCRKVLERLAGWPFARAWKEMQDAYLAEFRNWPLEIGAEVEDINCEEILWAITDMEPDLVLVSGTNLLSQTTITHIDLYCPILNLHTGSSPYVKGGPNCTNWCLWLGRPELIGNTVMWIDAGVDTGNIIASHPVRPYESDTLQVLHRRVMDGAHDLYSAVVQRFVSGELLNSIPQKNLGEGVSFRSKDWAPLSMIKAYLNFKFKMYSPGESQPVFIPLDEYIRDSDR